MLSSLIAVRNLIIERAPTRPKERTILDLIVITIKKIATLNKGKILATIVLFKTEFEWYIYIFLLIKKILSGKSIINSDKLVADNCSSDKPSKYSFFFF